MDPNIVEIDIEDNLSAFATYSVLKAMGNGPEAKLIFREKLISDEEM
jgi:hypothetical protein